MMATTHALVGFVIAAAAGSLGVPTPVALVAAVAGSVVPDLDLYAGHRRTLHFPVLGPVAAVGAVGVAVATGGALVPAAIAVFLVGAAVHARLDVFGGGLELRPWEATSERAVYDHVRGRWVPPRRVVRYDGAPEDLAFAGVLGAVAMPFHGAPALTAMGALLVVSAGYVLLRRPLAALAPRVAAMLPPSVRRRVPPRYVEG
jgi:hypothetical protein